MNEVLPSHEEAVRHLTANLRSLRRAAGSSQADAGGAAGISRNHYQLLEAGRAPTGGLANPRLSTLCALADAYDVRLESLTGKPVEFAVWCRTNRRRSLQEDEAERMYGALIDHSNHQLGDGRGVAQVEVDPTLALGIGVLAADPGMAKAVSRAGFEAAFALAEGMQRRPLFQLEVAEGWGSLHTRRS